MRNIYKIIESAVTDDDGTPITTYGITVTSKNGEVLITIPDIFDNRDKATRLAELCTDLGLAPEHLCYIIEDIL